MPPVSQLPIAVIARTFDPSPAKFARRDTGRTIHNIIPYPIGTTSNDLLYNLTALPH